MLPQWLDAWWRVFGGEAEPCLGLVRRDGEVVGLCPLKVVAGTASFIGSADVCDYMDFVVCPGEEASFFAAVSDELKRRGVGRLDLESLRPDSAALKGLEHMAPPDSACRPTDVSLVMPLGNSWEDYLGSLESKQRHEIGRKLRRLEENGRMDFRIETTAENLPVMLSLMRASRSDKANFLTERMEQFFNLMAGAMVSLGILRLGFLDINGTPVASILCFDYDGTRYLYNSGYDPAFAYLSAGLLSKVLCIRDAIEKKMSYFDFLKGAETYKYQLGGQELTISRCQAALK